ncbi:MAG: CDGSH iron-sulfur domain-containing protein [Magnetococcales bacterium]|nr:CDGSH iron-sulfur domain-containing protein [Magnetococcales bacterium]
MSGSDAAGVKPAQVMYDQGGPYKLQVSEGENLTLCQCGRSERPPLCTGRHRLENDKRLPLKFTARTTGEVAVCGCGRSRNMPWCDASHGLGSCVGSGD